MKSLAMFAVVLWGCSASSGTSSDGGLDALVAADVGDAAVVTANEGFIVVSQGINGGQGTTSAGVHNGAATFNKTLVDPGVLTGPCKFYPTYATSTPTYRDAGSVSITGGLATVDLQRLSSSTTPMGTGEYIVPIGAGRFSAVWNSGQMLTAKVSGTAEVPAAQLTVAGASQVTITSPEIYPYITVVRGQDLNLTWTGGMPNAKVVLAISMTLNGAFTDTSPRLICQWDSAAGKGTLPASTLGMLPAGEAIVEGSNELTTELVKGDWHFTFATSFKALATCTSACGGTIREVMAAVTIQ